MLYNPYGQTYGYEEFDTNYSYQPLHLDPAGMNFEYDNINGYNYNSKNVNNITYDPPFINNKLNQAFINNKNNIENYFLNQENSRYEKIKDKKIIPEHNYGNNRQYYFPSRKEHIGKESINLYNIMFILILIYVIINIYLYKNMNKYNTTYESNIK